MGFNLNPAERSISAVLRYHGETRLRITHGRVLRPFSYGKEFLMGMHVNSALPDPAQIKEELPLAPELKALKAKRDAEIRDVFTGASNKFLVIVGPCPADNEDAVCEPLGRACARGF